MATIGKNLNTLWKSARWYAACVLAGAILTAGIGYSTIVKSGDRAVREGQATITELKAANSRLQSDLSSATATAGQLEQRLDDRQRVINSVNRSVEQLAGGFQDSTDTIDQVIQSISDIERILQDG